MTTNDEAARKIQQAWRKRHANHLKNEVLKADVRWNDAVTQARMEAGRSAAVVGSNETKDKVRRAAFFASRLHDSNPALDDYGIEGNDAAKKQLETQHWLELIDGKHRYGSNLKWYHKKWLEADTEDNFFKWLDHGAGKTLSLDNCPRSQLEKERITFLSVEQRLNYLVEIDAEGKLRWARNHQLVDTSAGRWKDSGNGRGIVPIDASLPNASSQSLSSEQDGEDPDTAATHYAGGRKDRNRLVNAFNRAFTPSGMMDRLLRKTISKNTWIYVADKNFNLFIGIKATGTFQHSSFLSGGFVTSAGLIKVKEGLIHSLTPLSGHYRTSIDHFHVFIDKLQARGANIEKVKMTKAEFALWFIERLGKLKTVTKVPWMHSKHKGSDSDEGKHDDSWKAEILHGRRKKEKST